MTGPEQPNHEPSRLSTQPAGKDGAVWTDSEAANTLRYQPGVRGGHVESLFLKGNSPDGKRALWIKQTLLAPKQPGQPAVAELWAVAFRRDSKDPSRCPVANKRTFPIAEASFGSAPFFFRLPGAEFTQGHARGEIGGDGNGKQLSWDLAFDCPSDAFRPFPNERMYKGPFPRTKTLTPVANTRLSGFFEVEGERWDVTGYAAAQGHNWGKGHSQAYAWVHGNAFTPQRGSADVSQVWLEALSGRVRVGPVRTPWLSCAAICIDDTVYRFDGTAAMLSRRIKVDDRSYQLELAQGDARLKARFWADPNQIAGLRYDDPDGQTLSCLNSKLAWAEVAMTARGRTWTLKSDQVALELGTRKDDHGIAILV